MGIMLGWVMGWAVVGFTFTENPKGTLREVFKPCATNCEAREYAVPTFRVGAR